jgi:hypothetical protein
VFLDSLTLILVEGPPDAVREFVRRARACSEHPLRVERDESAAAKTEEEAGRGAREAASEVFRGVFAQAYLRSAAQLRDLLHAAGFADWLREEALPGGGGDEAAEQEEAEEEGLGWPQRRGAL